MDFVTNTFASLLLSYCFERRNVAAGEPREVWLVVAAGGSGRQPPLVGTTARWWTVQSRRSAATVMPLTRQRPVESFDDQASAGSRRSTRLGSASTTASLRNSRASPTDGQFTLPPPTRDGTVALRQAVRSGYNPEADRHTLTTEHSSEPVDLTLIVAGTSRALCDYISPCSAPMHD